MIININIIKMTINIIIKCNIFIYNYIMNIIISKSISIWICAYSYTTITIIYYYIIDRL